MSIVSSGERYCKLMHVENGRVTVRRIYQVMVQAVDGRLYSLTGDRLPDAICIASSIPNEDARADIILGLPRVPTFWEFVPNYLDHKRTRDFAFMFLGMFITVALGVVAESVAQMLNV